MAGFYRMFKQTWNPPADPKESFAGKTVIVTGSNTGLGFEAALKFVNLDAARVILGVRNPAKGEQAKSLIIEQRSEKKDRVEVWELDMGSYDSIRAFAQRASGLDRLDIAVLNAGVYQVGYEESKYGWEVTLQVNVLSTALLGLLLLPKLQALAEDARPGVLEIVSSGTHKRVEFSEEHQQAENVLLSYNAAEGYVAGQQYGLSKLFMMYAMETLASLVKSTSSKPDVIVTSVCPGACKSELARGYDSLLATVGKAAAFAVLLRTAEQGSRSLVSGVTLGEKAHGRFWQHDELQEPVPLLSGEEGETLRKKVWSEVVQGLLKDAPWVSETLADLGA